MQRKDWRMSCDIGKATEELENEMWRRWRDGKVGEWAEKASKGCLEIEKSFGTALKSKFWWPMMSGVLWRLSFSVICLTVEEKLWKKTPTRKTDRNVDQTRAYWESGNDVTLRSQQWSPWLMVAIFFPAKENNFLPPFVLINWLYGLSQPGLG